MAAVAKDKEDSKKYIEQNQAKVAEYEDMIKKANDEYTNLT